MIIYKFGKLNSQNENICLSRNNSFHSKNLKAKLILKRLCIMNCSSCRYQYSMYDIFGITTMITS